MNREKLVVLIKSVGLFLKPYVFPTHHRRVTNKVLLIGGALLVDDYFFGGVIRWVVLSFIQSYIPADIPVPTETDGGLYGALIIVAVLTYSGMIHFIDSIIEVNRANVVQGGQRKRDKKIYSAFMKDFGSRCGLDDFLREHDFGTTWSSETDALYPFVRKWGAVELKFMDNELDELAAPLLVSLKSLARHLESSAGPLQANAALLCIFDPSIHSSYGLPLNIKTQIKQANELANDVIRARDALVGRAEQKL